MCHQPVSTFLRYPRMSKSIQSLLPRKWFHRIIKQTTQTDSLHLNWKMNWAPQFPLEKTCQENRKPYSISYPNVSLVSGKDKTHGARARRILPYLGIIFISLIGLNLLVMDSKHLLSANSDHRFSVPLKEFSNVILIVSLNVGLSVELHFLLEKKLRSY